MISNEMFWLAAIVIFVVAEALTQGLVSIWFAGGALAAFVLSMLKVSPVIQWTAFCLVSLILLNL